ncbi:hypothetical protein GCM10009422_13780 [Brevundimonas kwangchunensis]|uniref:Uncharacterized protein n=1 Tax=Brevundimonas kwangchunensis TaxID=322163 RepID=A0ABN1GU05_9CAUL
MRHSARAAGRRLELARGPEQVSQRAQEPEPASPLAAGSEPALPKLERASGSAQPSGGAQERRRQWDAARVSGSQEVRASWWPLAMPERLPRARGSGQAPAPAQDRPRGVAGRCSDRA